MAKLRLRAVIVVAVILHMLIGLAWARFQVEKNSIKVMAPVNLEGTYDCAISHFGTPQYGGTMMGTVVYPEVGASACFEFNQTEQEFKRESGGHPVIALVDRGGCFFAQKVYNAQLVGASAVLVVDDRVEELIPMDSPEGGQDKIITIPSALVQKDFGDKMKKALAVGEMVIIKFDWTETTDERVKYEFWTNSSDERVEYDFWTNINDECGPKCDAQVDFVKNFRGAAQLLERGEYTLFTPHYITSYCPPAFIHSKQCRSLCINRGRYCAPDPEQDFGAGYDGKDLVAENLRQLCVYKVAKDAKKPWAWWDYVTDFQIRCPMKSQKYSDDCAEAMIDSLGLSVSDVKECIGDPKADEENPILKAEQDALAGHGQRGDVTMMPTLMVNQRQYRGKLDKGAVLKAICSGFKETTDPPACLSEEVETNECLHNNGGCWQDVSANVTACRDTFRGRVCECPLVQGVQFEGDGYETCKPQGPGRCKFNNGGCWQDTQGGVNASACSEVLLTGCKCPEGFRGDGVKECVDINECSEKSACQCSDCTSPVKTSGVDTISSVQAIFCKIFKEHDTCLRKLSSVSRVGWWISLVAVAGVVAIAMGGYMVYKYRKQSYMDSESRAIKAQYMSLDSQAEMNPELNTVP